MPNTTLPPESSFLDPPAFRFSATDVIGMGDGMDTCDEISLWAAFAPEHGNQNYYRFQEVYAPAVLIRRNGTYEFCDMGRPWLDGIQPAWRARQP